MHGLKAWVMNSPVQAEQKRWRQKRWQWINAAQLTRIPASQLPAFDDPDTDRSSEPP